ncbi:hypothetical protein MXB_3000 [Myxobolus squamalis]|nr:hypothetical protein MXB_3000 [Myxobolus squamalis]
MKSSRHELNSKGFLTRKLYNSNAVMVWRDMIIESKKILSGMENDENMNPETDFELRQRLFSEARKSNY